MTGAWTSIVKRPLLTVVGTVIAIPFIFVLAMLFYPRSANLTPAHTYESNGQAINYCKLPNLNGSGLLAGDFPQGHTPDCGYGTFPKSYGQIRCMAGWSCSHSATFIDYFFAVLELHALDGLAELPEAA